MDGGGGSFEGSAESIALEPDRIARGPGIVGSPWWPVHCLCMTEAFSRPDLVDATISRQRLEGRRLAKILVDEIRTSMH